MSEPNPLSSTSPPPRRRVLLKVLAIGLGIPLLPLVFLYAWGLICPNEYERRLSLTLDRPPQAVWDAIADFHKHPATGDMARGVELVSDGDPDGPGPAWIEDLGGTKIRVTTLEADSPRRLVRRFEDQRMPMTARWQVTLEPIESGQACRITATNHTAIHGFNLAVPMFRLAMRHGRALENANRVYFQKVADSLGAKATFEN